MREMPCAGDDLDEFSNEEKAELDRFAEWLASQPVAQEWARRVRIEMERRAIRNGKAG